MNWKVVLAGSAFFVSFAVTCINIALSTGVTEVVSWLALSMAWLAHAKLAFVPKAIMVPAPQERGALTDKPVVHYPMAAHPLTRQPWED